jgi:hypothetical protein
MPQNENAPDSMSRETFVEQPSPRTAQGQCSNPAGRSEWHTGARGRHEPVGRLWKIWTAHGSRHESPDKNFRPLASVLRLLNPVEFEWHLALDHHFERSTGFQLHLIVTGEHGDGSANRPADSRPD